MTRTITPTRPMRGEGRGSPGVRRVYKHARDIKIYVAAPPRIEVFNLVETLRPVEASAAIS